MIGLRNQRDLRCLGLLLLYPSVIACHWLLGPNLFLTLATCLMAYSLGCVQHCHGHVPFFRHRIANRLVEFAFTLLRGDGCYAWKSTHNVNHHRYANRLGDYTLTWRFSAKNNLLQFLLYLGYGSCAYVFASVAYLGRSLYGFRFLGLYWLFQIITYISLIRFLIGRDFAATIYAIVLPQVFGIVAMIGTGYFQHQHTDEEHEYNSCRNFTGTLLNVITFNHGYHLVHHLHINMHWTEWPYEHHRLKQLGHLNLHDLNQKSLSFYILRIFLLQHFHSRYASVNLHSHLLPFKG